MDPGLKDIADVAARLATVLVALCAAWWFLFSRRLPKRIGFDPIREQYLSIPDWTSLMRVYLADGSGRRSAAGPLVDYRAKSTARRLRRSGRHHILEDVTLLE